MNGTDPSPATPPGEPRILGLPAPWFHWLVGLVAAPVLTFTPLLRYVAWFLSSLVHEIGHCVVGFMVGLPALPAIRMDGHAAAVNTSGWQWPCAAAMTALVWWLAWEAWRRRIFRWPAIALAVLQPVFAWAGGESLRWAAFLAGGHLGELAFAGVFLWRAFTGGFIQEEKERPVYAAVGWYLTFHNVFLFWGLAFSDRARAFYASNGSFGMENDLIRVARDHLGTSLDTAAAVMVLVSLLPPVLAWLAWKTHGDLED